MDTLKGLITAMVTPFDRSGEVDVDALKASVRFQLDQGVSGLCPLGGTGEPLAMTVREHQLIIDTVVNEAAGRVPIVVGTLASSARDQITCARHARAAGADAIMVAPPHFYGMTLDPMIRHFQDVGEQARMPMVLFHSPGRTGIRLSIDDIMRIFGSSELFVGIKESSNDMTLLAELIEQSPTRIRILQGYETNYLGTLALGGHGAILSLGCLIPRLLQDMYQAWLRHDMPTAQNIQTRLLALSRHIYCEPNPGPLKFALKLAGRSAGPARPPIYPPAQQTCDALRALLPQFLDD